MVTKTLKTITVNAETSATDPEPRARIVRVIRNMNFLKTRDQGNVLPVRTENHPSPMKQSASNRQPGQSHTRTTMDGALNQELAMARYLMDDLADHIFGHIVSTRLARDILRQFIDDGIVEVFEGTTSRHNTDGKVVLDRKSEDAQRAIDQAFEDADTHDCIRSDTEDGDGELQPPSSDTKRKGKQAGSKKKGKRKQNTYTFKWSTFPKEPIDEDELVSFLNEITDRALDFARPQLANSTPNNRFAARKDKNHAMPLSYEPDGEDMRPDFLLLPIQAFIDDFKTVDPKYLNFTATRLVGEAKNKDLAAGVEQVQRYARGLKRAQPWVHYVLAMTITRDKAVFMRGEGSGTERLEMILTGGRGCIEFIRILLGLALAEDVDLGQNPDVELGRETRTCEVNNVIYRSVPSNAPSSATISRAPGTESVLPSGVATSNTALDTLLVSSRTRSASAASKSAISTRGASVSSKAPPSSSHARRVSSARHVSASSASSKRIYSEIGDGSHQERRQKKAKIAETVIQEERVVFFPLRVYHHTCLGTLFTSSSIRGRGTTVFCVVDLSDEKKRLAFKMSWQDLERVADQTSVMKRLKEKPHPNVIVPTETFNANRKGQTCTTLGAIRGFLDEQLDCVPVENRVLTISISELKRPVKYFWGVHDFVRGLRGALLGHEYLTSVGILHRDISENNVVLGLYPWEERGYLIDFDMAILQDSEEPTPASTLCIESDDELFQATEESSTQAVKLDEKKHIKALRTGTFPYISCNVLRGKRHTHFDDVESFLYVLLLFFFSYAGPLSKKELQDAHETGFVRPSGYGRLPHMRSWPKRFADWADGDPLVIASLKSFHILHPDGATDLVESVELKDCLKENWPEALHPPIRSLLQSTFVAFTKSTKGNATLGGRTELSHARFIKLLDKWLAAYSELEHKYSNCPNFENSRNVE